MRTATAATTCSKWKRAARSRARAPFDATGLPLHFDNQSLFKERIYRDKADARLLHDEITVFDHALTRPWIVDKKYVRNPNPRPSWGENNCGMERDLKILVAGLTNRDVIGVESHSLAFL